MPNLKQFKLPDLGEGLTEGEILRWLVKVGDEITLNQPIVEVETAKAAVEIPSPYAGVVDALMFEPGTTVDVGVPIITIDTDPGGTEPAPAPAAEGASVDGDDEVIEAGKIGGAAPGGRTAILVGYGPKTVTATRRPRKNAEPAAATDGPDLPLLPTIPDSLHTAVKPVRHGGLELGRALERAADAASAPVRAKPPVRKLAKDLGVDLATVHATGSGGTVTRDDVQRAARHAQEPAAIMPPAASASTEASAPESQRPAAPAVYRTGEREERRAVKGVRKLTADAMVSSAFTAPHVTEFVTVDVTRTMKLVAKLKTDPEFADVRVSPLLLVARAVLASVRRHPDINATFDAAAGEIIVKHYVNLGIAAATPRGLTVPNIKDADRLTLPRLARELHTLVRVAKDGKTAPADMAGGSITITNVGVFGVDTGTPIINPGEAAILAVGAIRDMPWVHKGKIRVRKVMQLGLSFDHRLVDGELGSLFLADVARVLERPKTLLTWS